MAAKKQTKTENIFADPQKLMTDWLDAAAKSAEAGKPMIDAQQKMWADGLAMWQEAGQTWADFAGKTIRQNFEQSLAVQQEAAALAQDAVKKSQEMLAAQQSLLKDSAELWQTNAKDAAAQMEGMFSPFFRAN